jgi:hypothetical protein
MVTDQQVRRLFMLDKTHRSLQTAAAKAGMDPKTARKYRRLGKLPSAVAQPHTWRTRKDPFQEVWPWCREQLELNWRLEAKALFGALQRRHPGRFRDGQLRTLQRRVKAWRATAGPPREVFFSQVHRPGQLCQSDFTDMSPLGVRIQGRPFEHLVYHFVLTYSNWEWGSVCFSESLEALSEGLQEALWKLGAVPGEHRTDRLSAAVCRLPNPEAFTQRYQALMDHYGIIPRKTQPRRPNEIGDVEQRHFRFKQVVDQALMLRGSRDFESRRGYESFLEGVLGQVNGGRQERLREELGLMRGLPGRRLEACKHLRGIRVDRGSLVHVDRNVYSVPSRLIGEKVDVRLYAERVELWYGHKKVEELPRVRGRGKSRINWRHVIQWLVRKPGAFENYRYRQDLFPTSRFRMTYDALRQRCREGAARGYLEILHLAALGSESEVDGALQELLCRGERIDAESVRRLIGSGQGPRGPMEVAVDAVDLCAFDGLLSGSQVAPR